MTDLSDLNTLTPRDAVIDALHRALLGLDSNDRTLFASACLTTDEIVWTGGGYCVKGWDAVSTLFERVFQLITMHVISNIRVAFEENGKARATAHAVSYHVQPKDKEALEERSFTGYSLYELVLVKHEGDGLWKIREWKATVLRTTGDRTIVHG